LLPNKDNEKVVNHKLKKYGALCEKLCEICRQIRYCQIAHVAKGLIKVTDDIANEH
jgi:hypothetical protein